MHCDYAVDQTSEAMVVKVAWFMGGKVGGVCPVQYEIFMSGFVV